MVRCESELKKSEQKRLKKWKKYLRNDENISELVKFLLQDCSHSTHYAHLFPLATILLFNCGSRFFRLSLKNCLIECVSELPCDQEEAYTKVFLCTKDVEALGASDTCISIVNSDIAIYALYFPL